MDGSILFGNRTAVGDLGFGNDLLCSQSFLCLLCASFADRTQSSSFTATSVFQELCVRGAAHQFRAVAPSLCVWR